MRAPPLPALMSVGHDRYHRPTSTSAHSLSWSLSSSPAASQSVAVRASCRTCGVNPRGRRRTARRTVGKRVGGNPSRVRISYPPPLLSPGNTSKGPTSRWGPSTLSSDFVVLVFVHSGCFRGSPDGVDDLPGDVLEHGVGHMEVPRPHACGGARLPPHDLINDPVRDAEQHEHGGGRVPGVVQSGVRTPASSSSCFQSW